MEITRDDLAAMKAAHDSGRFHKPVIKLGHLDGRFDGEPALGIVDNLQLTDDGNTLIGDLVGVPAWLAEIAPSAYPNRSIEALLDLELDDGTTHSVLTGLALLGAFEPAVTTLQSLTDIKELYEVAASAGRSVVIATRTTPARASTLHTLPPRERVRIRVAAARRRHRTAEHLLATLTERTHP